MQETGEWKREALFPFMRERVPWRRETSWFGKQKRTPWIWEVVERGELGNRKPEDEEKVCCVLWLEEKLLSFSKTLYTSALCFTYYFYKLSYFNIILCVLICSHIAYFLKIYLLIMLLQSYHLPPFTPLHPAHLSLPHSPPIVHIHGSYLQVLWLLHFLY